MPIRTNIAALFSPNLFWDIDEKTLFASKNKRFIIERVLSKGRLSDWDALNRLYGVRTLKKEIVEIRYLDKVTLNFCSTYFHIPKPNFRCYTQPQSIQQLWQY
jgi:hypothetical protein